jgi:hypothetical protein
MNGEAIRPPMPTVNPAPSNEPELMPTVPIADYVAAARLCQTVVSPDFVVNPDALVSEGWSFTTPRQQQNELGRFESISYFKGQVTIGLLDFGTVVLCRVVAFVSAPQQVTEIRDAISRDMGAVPMRDVPAAFAHYNLAARNLSEEQQSNLMIAGNYGLELAAQAFDPQTSGFAEGSASIVVILTSRPLPPNLLSNDRAH